MLLVRRFFKPTCITCYYSPHLRSAVITDVFANFLFLTLEFSPSQCSFHPLTFLLATYLRSPGIETLLSSLPSSVYIFLLQDFSPSQNLPQEFIAVPRRSWGEFFYGWWVCSCMINMVCLVCSHQECTHNLSNYPSREKNGQKNRVDSCRGTQTSVLSKWTRWKGIRGQVSAMQGMLDKKSAGSNCLRSDI